MQDTAETILISFPPRLLMEYCMLCRPPVLASANSDHNSIMKPVSQA